MSTLITSPVMEHANMLAEQGRAVVPLHIIRPDGSCGCGDPNCKAVGKHPRVKWNARDMPEAASVETVERWFTRWPDAGLAILTGKRSNLIAVDEDPRNGGDVFLQELLAEHGDFPDTWAADTPSGGHHYYFAWPGFYVKTLAHALGPGVDIKGDGGLIVVEPSAHKSGGRYVWQIDFAPGEIDPADAPAWLIDRLRRLNQPKASRPTVNRSDTERGRDCIIAERLLPLLKTSRADEYDSWLKVGMILHDCDPGAGAFDLWERWSKISAKFEEGVCARKWASFHTHHANRCTVNTMMKWANADASRAEVDDALGEYRNTTKENGQADSSVSSERPTILLPSDETEIRASAQNLGELLAQHDYYTRGDNFARVRNGQVELLTANQSRSIFEEVGDLHILKATKDDGAIRVPRRCSESSAKAIVEADAFIESLPPITAVTHCPALVEENGTLATIAGYHKPTGIYAMGTMPDPVDIEVAKASLLELLADFAFVTPADKARAMAAMLTPGLIYGKLLGKEKRCPALVVEADQSQAGKGYLVRLNAAIYGTSPQAVTTRKGGVGSVEEAISRHLIASAPYIYLDNLRGRVDLPWLEMALTEPLIDARMPYSRGVSVDPSRTAFAITSNKAELTPDLANRCIVTRITKQADGYQFIAYNEGDLVEHVHARQPHYLGAVYAVIQEWHRRGKPGEPDGRHDMRAWAGAIGWLTTQLFELSDPLEGHREVQRRTSNRSANWLRDVCLAIEAAHQLDRPIFTHELFDILADAEMSIPRVKPDDDPEDEDVRRGGLQGLGRRLGGLFRKADGETLEIDRYIVERGEATSNRDFKVMKTYTIRKQDSP